MTTPEQRAEWQRLADAATKGPWPIQLSTEGGRAYYAYAPLNAKVEQADADACFLHASRTALPALLADVEELEAEREKFLVCLSELVDEITSSNAYKQARDVLEKISQSKSWPGHTGEAG